MFSEAVEYDSFRAENCDRCKRHITRTHGFAEFPCNGGCLVENAIEDARYLSPRKFPEDYIVNGKCIRFEALE